MTDSREKLQKENADTAAAHKNSVQRFKKTVVVESRITVENSAQKTKAENKCIYWKKMHQNLKSKATSGKNPILWNQSTFR